MGEVRVKVGVKESFNKKLARSRLIDMGRLCGKNGRWKLAESRRPESEGEEEARKTEIAMGIA